MDQHQRRARVINMRKARPLRPTTDPNPDTPCTATAPHTDGGTYTCTLTGTHTPHFDEKRSVHWLPDDDTTEGAR
ncbi:hypothetical protein ACFVS9_28415 [Streptomyces sp. NPDC058008]|uniref:hypothetical protein n=1 Tax=Streptomyces sp. NPDC058008 TaxID=3346303 RepID=UPI0036E2E64A